MKRIFTLLAAAVIAATTLTAATPAQAAITTLTATASCRPPGYIQATNWVMTYQRNSANGQVKLVRIKWNASGTGMSLSDVKTSNQGAWQIGSGGPFSVSGSWVNSFTWTGETRYLVLGNCKTARRTIT
jgi:hypothetical protein